MSAFDSSAVAQLIRYRTNRNRGKFTNAELNKMKALVRVNKDFDRLIRDLNAMASATDLYLGRNSMVRRLLGKLQIMRNQYNHAVLNYLSNASTVNGRSS